MSRNNSPEAQCRPGLCLSGSRPQACHQLCSRCHCAERLSPQQWQEGARGVEGKAPQEATRVATLLLLMTMRCPGQLRTAGQEAWQVPEALTRGLLGGLTFQRPRPGADLFVPGRDSGGLLTTEGQLGWALAPGFFGGHTLTLGHPAGTLPSSPGQPQPPASSPRVPANTRCQAWPISPGDRGTPSWKGESRWPEPPGQGRWGPRNPAPIQKVCLFPLFPWLSSHRSAVPDGGLG